MHDRRSRPLHAEIEEGRFFPFTQFQFLRALSCFWFVWTQRKRNHVLKDHDWYDFLILLLSRVQVQLLVDRLRQGHG